MTRRMYLAVVLAAAWNAGSVTAQAPAAPVVSSAQTTAAVKLVTKTYVPNPLAQVEGSKQGLPKNRSWGARAATAAELTGSCDETGALCVAVLYHAGTPEITCRWTVLFAPGDSVGRVVSQSEATATYMLRAFAARDPDAPRLVSGEAPDTPPIARIAQITGSVSVLLDVDPSGAVRGSVISGGTNAVFYQSVLNAIKGWKLEPTILEGQRVWAQVAVEAAFAGGSAMLSIKQAK